MFYYVEPNKGGITPIESFVKTDGLDRTRLFASVLGASKHKDAPPVTPIKKIESVAFYDARDVIKNNHSLAGLTPIEHRTSIEVEI